MPRHDPCNWPAPHPFDLLGQALCERLRASNGEDLAVTKNEPLTEGLYLSWDSDEGDVTLKATSPNNGLLTLSAKVGKKPRWFSLNIDLKRATLAAGQILGIALRARASQNISLTLTMRSAWEEGNFGDTQLTETPLAIGTTAEVFTVLYPLQPYDDAIGDDRYHTLILPLPDHDFQLDLLDLRIFIQPAENNLRTLGNAA